MIRRAWFLPVLLLSAAWAVAQDLPIPMPPGPIEESTPLTAEEAGRQCQLGATALKNKDYARAEKCFRAAVAIREKTVGPEHPDTASAVSSVARTLAARGQPGEAEPLYKRVLAIRETALGPNHPDVADTLDELALCALQKVNYEQATELSGRAWTIRVKALGRNHPDVAKSFNTLGTIAHVVSERSGGYRKPDGKLYHWAERYFQQAVELRENKPGLEDQTLAQSLNNLATVYVYQKRYGEADALMRRVLPIEEKLLGPDHPDLAMFLNQAASLRRKAHRDAQARAEARELTARAKAIRSKTEGSGSHIPSLAQRLGLVR